MSLLAIIFLAIMGRCEGGAISLGAGRTMLARILFWALPVAIVCFFIAYTKHYPLWIAAISGLGALGVICVGHSSFQNNTIGQNLTMSAYGLLQLFPIVLPFIYFDHSVIKYLPFGLLYGLGYFLGWRTPFAIPNFATANSSEWSEFIARGLAVGLPLALLGWL